MLLTRDYFIDYCYRYLNDQIVDIEDPNYNVPYNSKDYFDLDLSILYNIYCEFQTSL